MINDARKIMRERKESNTMKLNKIVMIIFRIAEICYWVGTAMCAVIAGGISMGQTSIITLLSDVDPSAGRDLVAFGFSIFPVDSQGNPVKGAYLIFFIAMVLMMALMAMVCRNIYLIFKTSAGETSFSKGQTPFQPDNIRMVREIGIFLMAIPVVGLIMSVVSRIALAGMEVETSVDLHFVMIGLAMICLSRFFAYGMELQDDVDGLV